MGRDSEHSASGWVSRHVNRPGNKVPHSALVHRCAGALESQEPGTFLGRPAIALVLILAFLSPVLGSDEIYSYFTEDGVKVITNLGSQRGVRAASEPAEDGNTPEAIYRQLIRDEAGRYGIDEGLVQAIIRVESNFDPLAVSVKNCKGLMQLHPDTAARFGVGNIFDPAENIAGGVRYLNHLLQSFEEIDHVLAAYNAGENAVRRYSGIPPYRETVEYVEKVKAIYGEPPPGVRSASPKRTPRITRMVDEDGRILFTNAATSTR